MQQVFTINSYNLMQQYIYNIYILNCFYKVGDLECSEACLGSNTRLVIDR
jgi:hypothetical protein